MTHARALRARSATIHWFLVVQAMVSAAPAMALVAAGLPVMAARYLFISLAAQLGYYILTRNRLGYVTVLVSCIPAAMMLRDHFLFNSVIVLLAAGLALWLATGYEEFKSVGRSPAFSAFVAIAFLYWWISFLRTGNYASNLRILDLALAAASILLLGRYRSYLSTALVGMALCTVAVGAGLSPYGDRLGMAEIGEHSLGNPILIGLPAALTLMMAIAHKGHWLLAESRPTLRIALSMGVAGVLVLSTSRGSWLVAVVGLGALFLGSRKRGHIALALAPIALAGAVAVASGRGAFVTRYLDRALDPELSMAKRTTGRYNQWAALPAVFSDSPVWGHGPGSGVQTNVRFTGSSKAWHSLYLQVAVEAGLIGITLIALLLVALWWKGVRHWKATGDMVPLMAALCFMAIGVSVSGMDAISGIYLGIAFLGRELRHVYVVREVVLGPAPAVA